MGMTEIVLVTPKELISCSGGKDSSKHPKIYLKLGKKNHVICPYCGKYFTTQKTGPKPGSNSLDNN